MFSLRLPYPLREKKKWIIEGAFSSTVFQFRAGRVGVEVHELPVLRAPLLRGAPDGAPARRLPTGPTCCSINFVGNSYCPRLVLGWIKTKLHDKTVKFAELSGSTQ